MEEMKQRALQYEKTLVLQTMQKMHMIRRQYKKDKLMQNKMTEELAEKMKADGKTDVLIMSAGPYKHNSCMSAYCVDAQKMAEAAGMLCWTDDGMVRYFRRFCFMNECDITSLIFGGNGLKIKTTKLYDKI